MTEDLKNKLAEKGLEIVRKKDLENTEIANSSVTATFNPVLWSQFREMANAFIKSGALPAGSSPEKLMVQMQAGSEMGMKPFEALRSLYIVNGMIAIGGRDLIKQLRKHGWSVRYFNESDESVSVEVTKDDEKYTETFLYDEAVKSGWVSSSKPSWKEGANRKLKMRYAVISKLVKSYIPEVMGSATDVIEVMEDTAPIYKVNETESIDVEDLNLINNSQTFEELTKNAKSLEGKYKVRTIKQYFDARKEALEIKQ